MMLKTVSSAVLFIVALTDLSRGYEVSQCRRKETSFGYKKSALAERRVRIDCRGQNVGTLTSDFLYEAMIVPPRISESGNAPAGVFHDVEKEMSATYSVNLGDSNIEYIEDGTFLGLPRIQVLNMRSNHLEKIRTRTFEGLGDLSDLNLDDNQITTVEPASFRQLRNLKYLTFSDNFLKELSYFTFQGLRASNFLNLENNNISVLHSGSFASMPNLENLYLSNNKIGVLDGGILAGLRKLRYLILSGNSIKKIRDGAFRGNPELESLDLSNNLVSEITAKTFTGLLHLRRLTLRNNKLTSIEDGAFISMPLLSELDLSHNALKTMRVGLFWGLVNLQYFHIVSNQMHETALEEANKEEDRTLMEAIGMICRKRGLHVADLRGNGLYDMLKVVEVDDIGFDFTDPEQHSCIF